MMKWNHVASIAAGLCLLVGLGCSRSAGRQSLEGMVTFDGEPLPDGSITFLPQPDTKSPTCGGTISQGRFSISQRGGASVGVFRVEITATRATGKKVKEPKEGKLVDEFSQIIPACYNRKSELTATVTDQGPNRFDFTLKSK